MGEDCKKQLDTLFKESLGIVEEFVIKRAHRLKATKKKKSNIPRTIVCRILNYKKEKLKYYRMPKH